MPITNEEFDQMYAESLRRLDDYIASQVTDRQIYDAKHHKNHTVMNEGYLRHRASAGHDLYLCVKCGQMETGDKIEPTGCEMRAAQICHHCHYWERAAKTTDNILVIDGAIYVDGGNKPNGDDRFLGFGGARWVIERDGKTWETNNLWNGSTIPQEFVEQLPNNARFVK